MGDSAGGNLAAAVSLLAGAGDFKPRRQVLIYPALHNCYTEASPYPSVRERRQRVSAHQRQDGGLPELYQRDPKDRENPYFAPLLAEDYRGLPDTLVLTAEFDPLRDEGEEYGRRLREAGSRVEIHRIAGAVHGYFALGIQHLYVKESFQWIHQFIQGGKDEKDAVFPVRKLDNAAQAFPAPRGRMIRECSGFTAC